MTITVEQRVRFFSVHWQDTMGWKAIPFWCVVAAEGLYASSPAWFQLSLLAGGAVLSWMWSRCLQPSMERRFGIMQKTAFHRQRGLWKKYLLVLVPLLGIQLLVEWLLAGQHRQVPLGWTEDKLSISLSSYLIVQALQIVDRTNLLNRRIWYAAATLICAVLLGALGYWPETYARGALLFGLTQCVLAVADLGLLAHLAGPVADGQEGEPVHE